MAFLDGYKSYIGAAIGVLAGVLDLFDLVDPATLAGLWAVGAGVFGAGIAGKAQKIADNLGSINQP